MKICVMSPGVAHALPRTRAFAPYFDEVHYVDLSGRDASADLRGSNITYHRPYPQPVFDFGGRRLRKLLATLNPDGIVCHFASGMHLVNSVLHNRCPVAAVAMGHDVLHDKGDRPPGALQRWVDRLALQRLDYICAKAPHLAAQLRRDGCRGPIEVNYWGAELNEFRPLGAVDCRHRLDLPKQAAIVLSPRAVEPRLNIHLVVEAFAKLRAHRPDAFLVIVGRVHPGYGARVEQAIETAGLRDHVRVVREVVRDELATYIGAADVVVSMARSEGFPNTVLEVMAARRPLVVGRLPEIEALMADGVHGRLCAFDAEAIAAAIGEVLSNPAHAQEMVEQANLLAMTHGDIEENGRRFGEQFRRIITQGRRKPASGLQQGGLFSLYFANLALRKVR